MEPPPPLETEREFGSEPDSPCCDVLVIGGGPAGSTISSLLVERGWNVVLVEKDRHPRFHIGESLLPMNLPIFEQLGVLDQVGEIGVVKPGIEICSNRYVDRSQTFYFENGLDGIHTYAFQVRRSEFDHILLQNSAKRGVAVLEGVQVNGVVFRSGSNSIVHTVDGNGRQQDWQARFVVDASGRNTFLSTRLGLKQKNRQHNSAAIFGHFRKTVRRPGRDEGNIGLYWFEHGWFWMIPLRDDVMSVGAVCWPDYLKTRHSSLDDFFWDTIALCPGVQDRMKNAELIGKAQATGNYSYRSRRMWGDGYILVGDAYAFVDPVFSSGVYLAMSSAAMGAKAVDACLRDGRLAVPDLKIFDRQVRGGLRTLSWFIYRFTTPAIHDLFMAPRATFNMKQAIISVLAGDVFRHNRPRWQVAIFKGIYHFTTLWNWGRSWASYRRRHRNVRLDFPDEGSPRNLPT